MSLCLIGLGSNEGDRQATLLRALDELGRQPAVRVLRQSRVVETAPVGGPPAQGPFLNAAAVLETSLAPEALLRALLEVEDALGRRRSQTWGPRIIDLDLLLYEAVVCSSPLLTLPHPRMAWRRFVLEPAVEVAADVVHPTIGWTIARLLEHLNTTKDYLAITGPVASGKTDLARRIAQTSGVRWLADVADPAQMDVFHADPARNAWATELEFLDRRARCLTADSSEWHEPAQRWVSDFWFDHCLAFARVWMAVDQQAEFLARWEAAARSVVRPKLVVMLDRPTNELLRRIGTLGPLAVRCWTRDKLDLLREAIEACLRRVDVGPVLRLADPSPQQELQEILAAAEAMK